jgi:hypothetical protein
MSGSDRDRLDGRRALVTGGSKGSGKAESLQRGSGPPAFDRETSTALARQVREQSKEQVLYPAPEFDPREAARDPLRQALG